MPVVCQAYNLLYFPVPKNACSSLKNVLWELNHDSKFKPFVNNGKSIQNIHQIYVSMRFDMDRLDEAAPNWRDLFRFAVVRDPIKRLVSAYRNRVLHHLELKAEVLEASGIDSPDLIPQPDFQHFVRHLDLYRKASRSISHHTDLQKAFIGDRLNFYDMICGMEELGALELELGRRTGREIKLPVLQNLGPSSEGIIFDDATREAIREFYREDYALLRDFYA